MSAESDELESRIRKLEATLKALTHRCEELEGRAIMMALAKLDDPRFAYWNWLLRTSFLNQCRLNLTILLPALNNRIKGEPLPREKQEMIEGISSDLMYGSGPLPSADEMVQMIKTAAEITHTSRVKELLEAVRDQDMYPELCDYLLDPLIDRAYDALDEKE